MRGTPLRGRRGPGRGPTGRTEGGSRGRENVSKKAIVILALCLVVMFGPLYLLSDSGLTRVEAKIEASQDREWAAKWSLRVAEAYEYTFRHDKAHAAYVRTENRFLALMAARQEAGDLDGARKAYEQAAHCYLKQAEMVEDYKDKFQALPYYEAFELPWQDGDGHWHPGYPGIPEKQEEVKKQIIRLKYTGRA